MDTGSLLLISAIIILVVFIVSRPFYSHSDSGRMTDQSSGSLIETEKLLNDLTDEKERLLSSLADLDMDFDLKKIPGSIYTEQRQILVQAAARIFKILDKLEEPAGMDPAGQTFPEKVVETSASPTQKSDEIEALIADRRRKREEKSAGFCPRCGKVLRKSDQFCPSCGEKVQG